VERDPNLNTEILIHGRPLTMNASPIHRGTSTKERRDETGVCHEELPRDS